MTTLTEFLLARIAEDEAVALTAVGYESRTYWESAARDLHLRPQSLGHYMRHDPARVLAECDARRRIVERFGWAARNPEIYRNDMETMDQWQAAWDTLADAAAIHAGHEDFDESWRP